MMRLHGVSHIEESSRSGIHLLWTPPYPTGHSVPGFTLRRRPASRAQTTQRCFDVTAADAGTLHRSGHLRLPEAEIWARSRVGAPWATVERPVTHVDSSIAVGWTYRFELKQSFEGLDIEAAGLFAYAARARDGRVVAMQKFAGGRCSLRGGDIDRVWIVAGKALTKAHVCGVLADDDWSTSTVLVSKLQLPFRSADATLRSLAEERSKATSRLLEGENLEGDFETLSRAMNCALARPGRLPACSVVATQANGSQPFDVTPLSFGLAMNMLPSWRRAYGLAWLDRAAGLTRGAVYDYRLEAFVPRADRDERRFDLQTVPRGYQLPRVFRNGPVTVCCNQSAVVVDMAGAGGELAPVLKGIRFQQLALLLDEPATAVVLFGRSSSLRYEGSAPGESPQRGTTPLSERTELRFPTPITELRLSGDGLFSGLALSVVPAGANPMEPVPIAATALGIAFVPTTGPQPPQSVELAPLTSRDAHAGFEISWHPPDHVVGAMETWPSDATSAPPTEVAWYELERSENGAPFTPFRELAMSSRNAEAVTEPSLYGLDVAARFPSPERATSSSSTRVRGRDILERDNATVRWGATYRYRVTAVDAIGRRSLATESPSRVLEKRRRPVPPGTPTALRDRPQGDKVVPAGAQVRVIEQGPGLDAADRARLGAHRAVALLRWGWGARERELDPEVREFRVYRQARSFQLVEIEARGAPTLVSGIWQLPVRFDRAVDANEMVGRDFVVDDCAFRVTGHGAGPDAVLAVARSVIRPDAVPHVDQITLARTKQLGSEPEHWEARVETVPRTDALDYEVVVALDEWLLPSTAEPRREGLLGVTSCDAEPYVPDRRAALEATSRPGNESTVATASVRTRYRGRPALGPGALGAVSSQILPRLEGDAVLHEFAPSTFGSIPTTRLRLERCASGPLLRALVEQGGDVALRRDDGRVERWILPEADRNPLLAQMTSGRVEDRFLPHIAAALGADADRHFQLITNFVPPAAVKDRLPNHPERYVYRYRLLDEAGHWSANAQVLAVVFEVPLYAEPPPPTVKVDSLTGGRARITVSHGGDSSDTTLLFHGFYRRTSLPRVNLSWIRNRPDLPLARVAILRDEQNVRLTTTTLLATERDGAQEATMEVTIEENTRLIAWAVRVSAAGVPSRVAGPQTLSLGVAREL